MKKTTAEEIEGILALCKKTFQENAQGDFTLIQTTEKPDFCLYNLYANPLQNTELVDNPKIRDGFKFKIINKEGEHAIFDTPEESYDVLTLIKNPSFSINSIYTKTGQQTTAVEENKVLIKTLDNFPNKQEIQKAFKTHKTKTKNLTLKDEQLIEQKPTTRKTTTEEKNHNKTLTLKKLKTKFKKTE